jgi:hypothetical protein
MANPGGQAENYASEIRRTPVGHEGQNKGKKVRGQVRGRRPKKLESLPAGKKRSWVLTMKRTKQLVAEIVGDGQLFNEGLHEKHVRRHGDQMLVEGQDRSEAARENDASRKSLDATGKTKMPAE